MISAQHGDGVNTMTLLFVMLVKNGVSFATSIYPKFEAIASSHKGPVDCPIPNLTSCNSFAKKKKS